jgi:hypothetical protein
MEWLIDWRSLTSVARHERVAAEASGADADGPVRSRPGNTIRDIGFTPTHPRTKFFCKEKYIVSFLAFLGIIFVPWYTL